MDIREIFENFAVDFERTVSDDDWSRLAPYLADDATYINVGFQQEKIRGRQAIFAYLQQDVANFDRRYDSRRLAAITEPVVDGQHLSRRWRSTYTLQGVPDLVVEGEARYRFEDGLIKEIEQELTPESTQVLEQWMKEYGSKLEPRAG